MSVLGDSVSVVSSSVVDDNFEELLTCPICFETDKELRLFPACQHFACTECVARIAAGRSTFRCPICREVVTLPVPVHRFAEQLREENRQRIARQNNRRRHQDRTGRRNQINVQQVTPSAQAPDTTVLPSAPHTTSTGGMMSSFHQELLAVGADVAVSDLDPSSVGPSHQRAMHSYSRHSVNIAGNTQSRQQLPVVRDSAGSHARQLGGVQPPQMNYGLTRQDRTVRSNQSGGQQVTPSAPPQDTTAPSTTSTGGVMSSFHQELLAVGPDVVVSNLDSSSAGNSCTTGQSTVASNVWGHIKNSYRRMSQSGRRAVIVIAVVVLASVVLYIIVVTSVLSSR